MEIVELRNKWQKSIKEVDDKFLLMIDALYQSYSKNLDTDFFDELPHDIKELLKLSQHQAKQGKKTLNKEVIQKYRQKYDVSE